MIVKILQKSKDRIHERMVECDTVHKFGDQESVTLFLYLDGRLMESPTFKEWVKIFIMENGKTVDRIDFKMEV